MLALNLTGFQLFELFHRNHPYYEQEKWLFGREAYEASSARADWEAFAEQLNQIFHGQWLVLTTMLGDELAPQKK